MSSTAIVVDRWLCCRPGRFTRWRRRRNLRTGTRRTRPRPRSVCLPTGCNSPANREHVYVTIGSNNTDHKPTVCGQETVPYGHYKPATPTQVFFVNFPFKRSIQRHLTSPYLLPRFTRSISLTSKQYGQMTRKNTRWLPGNKRRGKSSRPADSRRCCLCTTVPRICASVRAARSVTAARAPLLRKKRRGRLPRCVSSRNENTEGYRVSTIVSA